MADTRFYTKAGRRAVISATDLLLQEGEYALVCVPIPALEIARKMVRDRGYWLTSYAASYEPNSYTLPDAATMDRITAFLDEFLEATTDMDCNDLITELNDIEQAIISTGGAGGCGCGSGGGGETSPPEETRDTGDITGPTGTPPPGYDNWIHYQGVKCDIAWWIVNNIISDISWIRAVGVGTITFAGFAVGLTSVLSAGTLTGIIAGVIGIVAFGVAILASLSTVLAENTEDLVCEIVTGETTAESISNFKTLIATLLDAETADPTARFLLKQFVNHWMDTSQFNLLYAEFTEVEAHQFPTGHDCSGCGLPCTNFFLQTGVWLGDLAFDSAVSGTCHRVEIIWNNISGSCDDNCGPMEEFSIKSQDAITDCVVRNNYQVWSVDDCGDIPPLPLVWNANFGPAIGQKLCGQLLSFVSGSAWSIEFEAWGGCE